jgi:hypothetical protein
VAGVTQDVNKKTAIEATVFYHSRNSVFSCSFWKLESRTSPIFLSHIALLPQPLETGKSNTFSLDETRKR